MTITIEDFDKNIKEERKNSFVKPYDFTYNQFEKLNFNQKNKEYFFTHASYIVEKLRENSWKEYQEQEENFSSKMLMSLVSEEEVGAMTPMESITWFAETFPNHIYKLNLSNTNSRRSRAGKEFEAIIELILIGANIPVDSQGNVAKSVFMDKGLGKLVDLVSPGAVEYLANKRNTVLVSAKTTLRERWQEVPEEMGRTGAREMFLVTLDNSVSSNVIETLYDGNIQLVTTSNLKNNYYPSYSSVLTFEELLEILKDNANKWEKYKYSPENLEEKKKLLEVQLNAHEGHQFVSNYYEKQLEKMEEK